MKLRMIFFLGAAPLVLTACDAPPEGTTAEDVTRYETAVASIGCEMVGESDYLPVELQAGLTREQTVAITSRMLATGKAAKLSTGGVRLMTGACTPDA